jgi:hypothetical protein
MFHRLDLIGLDSHDGVVFGWRFHFDELVRRVFLQEGVFLEFLADHVHHLQAGQLEKLDRLLKLGRHDQLLRQFQVLFKFKRHRFYPF